ncbi:hypothetical protein COF07_31445, partial [Bacillus wiedmannii]
GLVGSAPGWLAVGVTAGQAGVAPSAHAGVGGGVEYVEVVVGHRMLAKIGPMSSGVYVSGGTCSMPGMNEAKRARTSAVAALTARA